MGPELQSDGRARQSRTRCRQPARGRIETQLRRLGRIERGRNIWIDVLELLGDREIALAQEGGILAGPDIGRHPCLCQGLGRQAGPLRQTPTRLPKSWSADGKFLAYLTQGDGKKVAWALPLAPLLIGLGYGPITPASSHVLARTASPRRMALTFSLKQTGVPLGAALAGAALPLLAVGSGWRTALLSVAGIWFTVSVPTGSGAAWPRAPVTTSCSG